MTSTAARDDFASITECAPLVAEIRARIERQGPITFRDFMREALYHPQHGYYRTPGGRDDTRRRLCYEPRGPPRLRRPRRHARSSSSGRRCRVRDASTSSKPARAGACSPETSCLGARSRTRLRLRSCTTAHRAGDAVARRAGAYASRTLTSDVTWRDDLPERIEGVVLSNELIDAFPVHRVKRTGATLEEVLRRARRGSVRRSSRAAFDAGHRSLLRRISACFPARAATPK